MISVPWISVIIFVLTWFPFIIIGFKKGWAYSLIFSIVLWLTTLIFVIVNLSIFNNFLWPLYQKLFFKNEAEFGIDLNHFKSYYKSSIILLTLLFEFILIYPFTFIVMHFINKYLLKKLFGHNLKKTKFKNEQKIIFRRKIKLSRMLGVSILGVSSIFPSATIASGASIIFVPYKKAHLANNINDYIAKIYALGWASNSKSSQLITSFMINADQRLIESMKNIAAFNFSSVSASIPNSPLLYDFTKRVSYFKDLYTDNKATIAIFKTILSLQKNSIDLLALDRLTMRSSIDANGNVVGYNNTSTDIFIDNLLEKLQEMINISDYLSSTAKNVIYDVIMESTVNSLSSIFYENSEKTKNDYQEGLQKLKDRQESLTNNNTRIVSEKTNRKSIIEILKQMSGNGDSFDYDTSLPIIFPIPSLTRQDPGAGELPPMVTEENRLSQISDDLFKLWTSLLIVTTNLEEDYRAKKNSELNYFEQYNNYKDDLDSVNKQIETKNNQKNTKQLEVSSVTTRISNNKSKVQSNEAKIVNLKVERANETDETKKELLTIRINNLEIENINLNASIKDDESLKQNLLAEISVIDADLLSLNQNKILIEKNIADSWKNYQDYKKLSADAEKLYKDAKAESDIANINYEDAMSQFVNQTSKVDAFISNYTNEIEKLSFANNAIINIQRQLDILKTENTSFKYNSSMNEWNFIDDYSIYYQTQYNFFLEKKESQYLEIWNNKNNIYKSNMQIFSSLINEWLGRTNGS